MSIGKRWEKECGHKEGANGRWEHRAVAKESSRIARRKIDRLINERYDEVDDMELEDKE